MEHHFALIAARNLMRAVELPPSLTVSVDPTLRAELIEGRDLHEHWAENMPIFNVTPRPRPAQPKYRSGKDFAQRHPTGAVLVVPGVRQQPDAEAGAERRQAR